MMIEFNRECSACSLKCGAAVGWSEVEPKNVKLIVVSDYPSYYETLTGVPLTSNIEVRKRNKKYSPTDWFNAGALVRKVVTELFNLNVNKEVYITNVIKCDPRNKTVTAANLRTCVATWFKYELDNLNKECPQAPMLIAGQKAYEAIKLIEPTITKPLVDLRREVHYMQNRRPMVFTFNPVTAAKGMPRLATKMEFKKNVLTVTDVRVWMPPLVGTPLWSFLKDIEPLEDLINGQV